MEKIYSTGLGDYLSLMASKEGISREELEKRVEIEPVHETGFKIFYFGPPSPNEVLEEKAKKYDSIVDLKFVQSSEFLGIIRSCDAYATGVDLRKEQN